MFPEKHPFIELLGGFDRYDNVIFQNAALRNGDKFIFLT